MWSACTVLCTAGSRFVNVASTAMIIHLNNSNNGLYHCPILYMRKKNLPLKPKSSEVLSAPHNTWLFQTYGVCNLGVLWMTAFCRARSLLPPGLSLYPRLLSLCDVQLQSPFPALLYSARAAASRFVLRASAVTRSERCLLPASKLVAAGRICAACGACCVHLFCRAALLWGQRFLSGRGILAKCMTKTLFIYLFKICRLRSFRDSKCD